MTSIQTGATPARVGRPPERERATRAAARRRALVRAAMDAIAADGPDVTMSRMAGEAGVTKPVLYRYFGDRAGLYEAIAVTFAEELLTELQTALAREDSPRRLLEGAVDTYLAYVERQPQVYRFLSQRLPGANPDGQRMVTGFIHRVAGQVTAALADGLRAAGMDREESELLGFGVTGMVQLAGEIWLERGTMPRQTAVRHLAGVLWQGLGDGVGADR